MVPLWDVFSHQTDGIVISSFDLTIANPDVVGYIHPYVSPTSRTGLEHKLLSSKYQKKWVEDENYDSIPTTDEDARECYKRRVLYS
jgi:hypothetical protein